MIAVLIGNVIAICTLIPLAKRMGTFTDGLRAFVVSMSLIVGGTLVVIFVSVSQIDYGTQLFISALFGAFAFGSGIGVVKIVWGEAFSELGLKKALRAISLSAAISVPLYLCIISLPDYLAYFAILLLEVFSVILLQYGLNSLKHESTESVSDTQTAETQPIRLNWSLLLLPALVALSFGLMRGLAPQFSEIPKLFQDLPFVLGTGLAGVLLFLCTFFLGKRFGATQIYAGALVFVAAGFATLPFMQGAPYLAIGIHSIGFGCFYFFMLVFWGDLGKHSKYSVPHLYAICLLSFQLFQLIGLSAGRVLGLALPEQTTTLSLSFAIVFILFVAALLVFGGGKSQLQRWLTGDWKVDRIPYVDQMEQACNILAAEYKLTDREKEVLALLARGRNAAHIGNALYVSKDTAKTHIKNIYRKLKIHSREELYAALSCTKTEK